MKPVAATVGTFDGVHRGHRLVLDTLLDTARESGADPVVFTFDRHPLTLIAPQRAPKRIMPVEDERRMLQQYGVRVVTLRFDDKLRSMTAAQWLRSLRDNYGVKIMVMGYDNTFGCDGRMLSPDDYLRIASEEGIEMNVAPQLEAISSSTIRRAITSGDISAANAALGRPFALSGEIINGQTLGRKIGFPTANLCPGPDIIIPQRGVYAALALTDDNQRIPAVVNIGIRPTVSDSGHISIEAHLIDWKGDLYNRTISLLFIDRIRDEIHFPDIADLKNQIAIDTQTAEAILRDYLSRH